MHHRVSGGLYVLVLFSFFLRLPAVFSAEATHVVDQDRLDHFSEKYPEPADFDPVPNLKMRGFGDISFSAGKHNDAYASTFTLGNIDLLFTSRINAKLSLLSELSAYRDLYYLDQSNPAFGNSSYLDFQRFALKYTISDDVNIGVGKYHTALGYWNHTYHHGTWLQSSILRPEIYRFEFQGGILPNHSVGVELFGFKAFDFFDLRYHIGVSNGRGKKLWVIQNFKDENRSKALTLFLTAQPTAVAGLRFGGTFYLDTIPEDPNDPAQPNPINERIVGGHLIYIGERYEFLGEFFKLFHSERQTGRDFNTEGGYLQGNIKIAALIAYYRYDEINFAEGNPAFFIFHRDIKKHTVGLRWDIFSWNALKIELNHGKRKNQKRDDGFLANLSFTF